jgi:hypothetical protein
VKDGDIMSAEVEDKSGTGGGGSSTVIVIAAIVLGR